jgi:hypothetical protein
MTCDQRFRRARYTSLIEINTRVLLADRSTALARLRQRLRDRGVRLILDFVPNHTALDTRGSASIRTTTVPAPTNNWPRFRSTAVACDRRAASVCSHMGGIRIFWAGLIRCS